MIPRLLTVGVVLFWLAAMGWLVHHDVVPAWTARDVPQFASGDWLDAENARSQARIVNKHGQRVGTVWTEYSQSETRLSRRDVIWIENFSIAPRLRFEADTDFTPEGALDEFHLQVYGVGEQVELVAEDFSGNLAFELKVGTRKPERFKVDAAVRGMIGDVFKPFPTLPVVEVGQSWRMHVLNPLAAISGVGPKLIPMLVRVTGKERVATEAGPVECFVVETDHARAWVDSRGIAVRQETDLLVGGKITIVAEPFDQEYLDEIRATALPSGTR